MANRSASILAYSVRLRVLAKLLGQLALAMAALTAVPLVASALLGETAFTWRFLGIIVVLLALGGMARLSIPKRIQANEALAVTALAFLLASLVSSVAYQAAGMSPMDAVFESISAVTTTGLSVIEHPADQPRTLLFTRAWMQWYGGLGKDDEVVLLTHSRNYDDLRERWLSAETLSGEEDT